MWADLPAAIGERFDAVMCTGNALVHAAGRDAMVQALTGLRRMARPGGHVVVDSRNWEKLHAERRAVQVMTSRAAQACGLGHRKGRIAPGFDADILAIGGDPLADLAAIRRLHAVYAGGLEVLPALGQPG